MMLFSAHNISAGYGSSDIVKDISFELDSGCLMGILGSNGSGKTTLIKAICGILPHRGHCFIGNTELEKLSPNKLARLCGYIPQRSGITINIPVLDVVMMGFNPRLGLLEHPDRAMKDRAYRVLCDVGLGEMADFDYQHLSEGQKQLCVLARTIVADTPLMLLDEPGSSLDFRFRYRMLEMLRGLVLSGDKSVLVSLHDPMLALNMCDKLLLLNGGKICGIVSPRNDPFVKTEAMLSEIYGNVSLASVKGKNGGEHIVMLKEDC